MKKPYDVTARDMFRWDPPSWMWYMRLNPAMGPIDLMDTDLSTVPAGADRVFRVGGKLAHLIHVEMQSHRDRRMPRRLWRYNAMLDLQYDLRVRSILLLLRREADSKSLTGILDLRLPVGDRVVTFHYGVIRAWEQPVEPLLAGPLATLPMATLANVPAADVPKVLEQIDSRLAAEAPPAEAGKIMASAMVLAGMRLDFDFVQAFGRSLRTMNILKDSSFYQVLLKEGREEGREIGRREGEIKGKRDMLIKIGRARFGRLPKAIRANIEAIDDTERLETLAIRVSSAESWDDLLATEK